MYRVVFLDTETSGLVQDGKPIDQQPHILSFSAITELYNDKTREFLNVEEYEIYNSDLTEFVNEEAAKTNGITVEHLKEVGIPNDEFINRIWTTLKDADVIICHNTKFDIQLLWFMAMRNRHGELAQKIIQTKTLCTSIWSRGFKFNPTPGIHMKLVELYRTLYGKDFTGAHTALFDTIALRDCTHRLFELGELKPASLTETSRYSYVSYDLLENGNYKFQITKICPKTFFPAYTIETSSSSLLDFVQEFDNFIQQSTLIVFRNKKSMDDFQRAINGVGNYHTKFGFRISTHLNNELNLESRDMAEYHKTNKFALIGGVTLMIDSGRFYGN